MVNNVITNYGHVLHNYWYEYSPDSKVHGANMSSTWVLSAPGGPHVGPMNLAVRVHSHMAYILHKQIKWAVYPCIRFKIWHQNTKRWRVNRALSGLLGVELLENNLHLITTMRRKSFVSKMNSVPPCVKILAVFQIVFLSSSDIDKTIKFC